MYRVRSSLSIALVALLASAPAAAEAPRSPLATVSAQPTSGPAMAAFDGVVEAVRQAVIAAQVAGAVVQLDVKAGDRVEAGQLLLRIDARAAEQTAAASDAQVRAARAALDLAAKDFARQQQLYRSNYISQAALERAESAWKSAQAQANATLAQAEALRTHQGYHLVRAPFAGVVSEVPVSLGDMAMPGRPLLTLYDPTALRVTAAVPQSVALLAMAAAGEASDGSTAIRIELPGLPAGQARITPAGVALLPTIDPGTHTVQLRADLPAEPGAVVPGMFARLWLPLPRQESRGIREPGAGHPGAAAAILTVPVEAIVRRAELTALYVLDSGGRPVLRQVRLGRTRDGRVEVLSGLLPDEIVVADPQSAARR